MIELGTDTGAHVNAQDVHAVEQRPCTAPKTSTKHKARTHQSTKPAPTSGGCGLSNTASLDREPLFHDLSKVVGELLCDLLRRGFNHDANDRFGS